MATVVAPIGRYSPIRRGKHTRSSSPPTEQPRPCYIERVAGAAVDVYPAPPPADESSAQPISVASISLYDQPVSEGALEFVTRADGGQRRPVVQSLPAKVLVSSGRPGVAVYMSRSDFNATTARWDVPEWDGAIRLGRHRGPERLAFAKWLVSLSLTLRTEPALGDALLAPALVVDQETDEKAPSPRAPVVDHLADVETDSESEGLTPLQRAVHNLVHHAHHVDRLLYAGVRPHMPRYQAALHAFRLAATAVGKLTDKATRLVQLLADTETDVDLIHVQRHEAAMALCVLG